MSSILLGSFVCIFFTLSHLFVPFRDVWFFFSLLFGDRYHKSNCYETLFAFISNHKDINHILIGNDEHSTHTQTSQNNLMGDKDTTSTMNGDDAD